jgi:hypothetical protein
MSAVGSDEETAGDRLDQRQKTVLMLLFSDPSLWTVQELGRELGEERLAVDAVAELAGAGLVHRLDGGSLSRAVRLAERMFCMRGRSDGVRDPVG